jgi:Arc/MetJ-type ribon-helix-helix transcriptional regulator
VKISVSLPDDDVSFIDEYAAKAGVPSRSSAIHRAIALLPTADLEEAYEAAFGEWAASEDAGLWDRAAGDGLTDATR